VDGNLAGFKTLTQLGRETGYSRTWIRTVARRHGINLFEKSRRTWVSPAGQKKLLPHLPPRTRAAV
jgi:DNA-directed RNA polymerase specialized sigma24 family protein